MTVPVRLDALAPLSHKELIGLPGDTRPASAVRRSWVPADDQRRLDGYEVLDAYALNVARLHLPAEVTNDERRLWREYGDVDALTKRIVAAVLGDDWQIVVDGADEDLDERGRRLLAGPDLPERPTEPTPAADGTIDVLAKRIHAGKVAAWEAHAAATIAAWEAEVAAWQASLAAQPTLVARQDALRSWAADGAVQFAARLHEGETQDVQLGDTVYVLWRRDGDWPTVEVYHPGFYFADLADDDRGAYPRRIGFGWEYDHRKDDGSRERRVRRILFELVPINTLRVTPDGTLLDLNGQPLADGTPFPTYRSEQVRDGVIWRQYPWADQGDLSDVTCVYSSASWALTDTEGHEMWDLPESLADYDQDPTGRLAHRLDQHCDFIPVIHVPNTPTGSEHYGVSTFTPVAQLLDDVAQTDTRVMEASRFLGSPTAGVSGAAVKADLALKPGTAIGLGEHGRMDMLDLSASIDKLYDLDDRLVDRLLANIGAPREVMGRVDDTTASGIHLLIKYLPWAQLVGSMRLPRAPKMELLLKFVQRLAQVAGVLEPGPTPVARVRYGNFLPMNKAEVMDQVVAAVGAHVLSTATGLRLLIAAGYPIDDAQAELEAIRQDDTEAAKVLADATGSEQLAAERLGLELPATAAAGPVVTLP